MKNEILRLVDESFPWLFATTFAYAFFKNPTLHFIFQFIVLISVVFILKRIVGRERPNHKDHYSFPSGHSALAWFIAWNINHPITYLWAGLVSWSRVYYFYHWWTDVFYSILLSYWINFLFEG